MSDTDNGSNGSSDNNSNNSVPENNPATETPKTETPSTEVPKENEPAKAPDTSEPVKNEPEAPKSEGVNYTPPVEANESKPQDSDASINDNVVAFSVTGNTNFSGNVPKGTSLKEAFSKFGGSINGLTLRDAKNNTLTQNTVINEPMNITATRKASGG